MNYCDFFFRMLRGSGTVLPCFADGTSLAAARHSDGLIVTRVQEVLIDRRKEV
jgi:hypothetical protein